MSFFVLGGGGWGLRWEVCGYVVRENVENKRDGGMGDRKTEENCV